MEFWKDVIGYEGLYQVSTKGSVRSYDKQVKRVWGYMLQKGRILKPCTDTDGYRLVNLYGRVKVKCGKVHRLVAKAFIDNPEQKPQVNHKNGNKADNSLTNLEWATLIENHDHAHDTGLCVKNKKRQVAQLSMNGELLRVFPSGAEAARQLSMRSCNISLAARGIFKQYHGYKWAYL